jgi:hypothetical protein
VLAELFSVAAAFLGKYEMKNISDKSIYLRLRDAGLVRNQYEFSELCGRNPTWFSAIGAKRLEISITALCMLLANIAMRAEATADAAQHAALIQLHALLSNELTARCQQRAVAAVRG